MRFSRVRDFSFMQLFLRVYDREHKKPTLNKAQTEALI